MYSAIDSADSSKMSRGDVDELAGRYADEFNLHAPELIEGAVSVTVDEAQLDVTGSILYGHFGPGPNLIPGIEVSYFVPFAGESEMFRYRPSTYSVSLGPISKLGAHELTLTFKRPGEDVASTKQDFDSQLSQIRQSLGWLRENCNAFNTSLPSQARQYVLRRRERLGSMAHGTQSLRIPIRRPAEPLSARSWTSSSSVVKSTIADSPETFDVALSFAGENRDYVEAVATGLRDSGVKIFYDKFETAKLWGKNLIEHLAEIYGKRSRFVVMFISQEYVEKAWTTHERQHAQARALLAQQDIFCRPVSTIPKYRA